MIHKISFIILIFSFSTKIQAENSDINISNQLYFGNVNLISFTGFLENNTVELNWKTMEETKNLYHEVQTSLNGSKFTKTATASAISKTKKVYTDSLKNEINRLRDYKKNYRLKIVKNVGSFSLSHPIKLLLANNDINLHPYGDSSMGAFAASFSSVKSCQGVLNILDESGKIFLKKSISVSQGFNRINAIKTADLPAGNYSIQIIAGDQKLSTRFVKF